MRHLLIAVGVFIFVMMIQTQTAHASSSKLLLNDVRIGNIKSIGTEPDTLENATIVRQQEIDDKRNRLESTQEQTRSLNEKKKLLSRKILNERRKIQVLQQRLKLKLSRIVPAGRNSVDYIGNNYVPGNCTWYVKQKRPDIGNNWGNANQWLSSARAAGYKTGNIAKTGAIGVSFEGFAGHVVYVEKWLGSGRLLISEMNFGALFQTNTRVVNEAEFSYIYEL